MKSLNLVDIDKSDIKYQISKFPDGQHQVVIDIDKLPKDYTWFLTNGYPSYHVQIKSRLNNFQDLELIICTTKSLRNLGVKEIHLYTPYFLGSRSDRQFEEGSNNYLKDVICPIINSLNFKSVTVLDPHSDILEACLNNFKKTNNKALVCEAIKCWKGVDLFYGNISKDIIDKVGFVLVSPDAGASKKIYKLAEEIDYKGDIITCSKDRDKDGKLTKCIVPLTKSSLGKDIIIIDDICDGGATFINIAKEIKKQLGDLYTGKIYLIVTHGIFSKGFYELSKYFDGIYCTNSYSNKFDHKYESINDTVLSMHYKDTKVKQLNVF